MLEFDACGGGCEVPICLGVIFIAVVFPGGDLVRALSREQNLAASRLEASARHCHAALGLRSDPWPNNRADEENQLQRISFPA